MISHAVGCPAVSRRTLLRIYATHNAMMSARCSLLHAAYAAASSGRTSWPSSRKNENMTSYQKLTPSIDADCGTILSAYMSFRFDLKRRYLRSFLKSPQQEEEQQEQDE